MAEKKFGKKRVCPHCEKKFYDLNKKSPLTCPCGEKQIAIEDEIYSIQNNQMIQGEKKPEIKDEFSDLESAEEQNDEDDVISLDEAAIEEDQQDTKS